VIDGLAPIIDFYSIHLYTGQADHYATVFQSHQAERAIRICAALIERARYAQRVVHPIHIAFDEWNVWYRTRSHEDRVGGVEERYNLTDALAVATYLHGFIRHCRTVRMANLAQLVNAIAPIFTSRQGLFLQTIYHPLRLYAEHTREVALDVHVDGPRHDLPAAQEEHGVGRVHQVADLGPFKLLDAVATSDAAGRELTLAVVNRDRDRSHPATVDLGDAAASGSVEVSEVNGPDVGATNSFEHPRLVDVRASWQLDPRQRLRLSVQGSEVERDQHLYTRPVNQRARDVAAQLLYSYKLNPRSAVYAGYSHGAFADDRIDALFDSNRSVFHAKRDHLQRAWYETSWRMQARGSRRWVRPRPRTESAVPRRWARIATTSGSRSLRGSPRPR